MSNDDKLDLRKVFATYLGLVFRAIGYWKLGLLVCVVVTAAGVAYAATRRKVWTSHTRIRVVTATQADLLGTEALDQMHETLEGDLKKFVTSRRFLGEVVDEYGLYREVQKEKNLTREEVLDYMRAKLYWGVYEGDEFGFHFIDYDPRIAQAVCKSLADHFIQQRQTSRTSLARTKLDRVQEQLEDVEKQLQVKEYGLQRFKEVNADLIAKLRLREFSTVTTDTTPIAISSAELTTPGANDSTALRRLRLRLRGLVEQSERMRAEASRTSDTGPDPTVKARNDLNSARTVYAKLRVQYTEEFPDVRRAKARVDDLERALAQAEAAYRLEKQQRSQPDANLRAVQAEIEQLQDEIRRTARREAAERTAQPPQPLPGQPPPVQLPSVEDTELALVDLDVGTPLKTVEEVETRLKMLTLDVEPLREQYGRLLRRRFDLEFESSLEEEQGGQQYVIIDPANLPTKPSGPNRTKIALAGAAGGMALGLFAMVLFGFIDSRLYRPGDLQRLEGVSMLVTVADFDDVIEQIEGSEARDRARERDGPYRSGGDPDRTDETAQV